MLPNSPSPRPSTDSVLARHISLITASANSKNDTPPPAASPSASPTTHPQTNTQTTPAAKSKTSSSSSIEGVPLSSSSSDRSKQRDKKNRAKAKQRKDKKMAPNQTPGVLEQAVSLLGTTASYIRLPALATTGAATLLATILYFKQKTLIYPSYMPADARTNISSPKEYGFNDFEELFIPTPDGEKLAAFYLRGHRAGMAPPANPDDPDDTSAAACYACDARGRSMNASATGPPSYRARNARTTLIMFHGNAGNIGHRLPLARHLHRIVGCNIFMVDYRGYGASTGEAGESGLCVDAQTVLDYLRARAETSTHKYVIYGQSLGGAVAIRLAADNQAPDVAGLILENTFLSMRKMIPRVLPAARFFSLLLHQVWPSDAVIPGITKVPILFLSGLQDEIVPASHMRALYDLSQAPNKIWKPLPLGTHNESFLEDGYFDAIADFVASATDDGFIEKPLV